MKTILAIFGAGLLFFWLMGELDIVDFKLCISAPGTCSVEVRK